ncbi:hypothetical protein ACFLUD_03410 [Chloroflexota bacterium]
MDLRRLYHRIVNYIHLVKPVRMVYSAKKIMNIFLLASMPGGDAMVS